MSGRLLVKLNYEGLIVVEIGYRPLYGDSDYIWSQKLEKKTAKKKQYWQNGLKLFNNNLIIK